MGVARKSVKATSFSPALSFFSNLLKIYQRAQNVHATFYDFFRNEDSVSVVISSSGSGTPGRVMLPSTLVAFLKPNFSKMVL